MARRFVLSRPDPADAHRGEPPRALAIDYAARLNPAQLDAVTAGGGATLVVAGAGTGKTRTLVYRVAYLVETGVPPEGIVLLTFTRRAAREMLARAAGLLDGRCERVRGGTFHAFCLGVLRRHAARLGYPPTFTLLDPSDAADVVDLLRTAGGFARAHRRFPEKRALYELFSAATNRDRPLRDLLEEAPAPFCDHAEAVVALADAYARTKRAHGLMDYDDLLARTVELLETDEAARRDVAGGCVHLLVDEYQDTNRLQARLTRLLASVHGNVTAVGDDAQSIYRFRGAEPRNILDFAEDFPNARHVTLEHNYRSTQPILDLANTVLAQASAAYPKRLVADREGGERPGLVPAPDEHWQSRFVAEMTLQLREEGVPLDRIAVLFRNGHDAFDLELELERRGIPFVKYGGLRLTEAAHVRDVVAHLRVAENPRDAAAWLRVLKLVDGVSARRAAAVLEHLLASDDPLATLPASPPGLAGLAALLDALTRPGTTLAVQLDAVLDYYQPILERRYPDDAARRAQDLEALVRLSQGFPSRVALLDGLALEPVDRAQRDGEAGPRDEPPLVLSTIHSAKGLEFDTVFLIHALDGVLPSNRSMRHPEDLDEELRLLYVALTRAARRLYVCYPILRSARGGGHYLTRLSRFLESVPPQLMEPWTLEAAPAAPPILPPGEEAPSA